MCFKFGVFLIFSKKKWKPPDVFFFLTGARVLSVKKKKKNKKCVKKKRRKINAKCAGKKSPGDEINYEHFCMFG